MKRNEIIDILRGIAVTLVVLYHSFPDTVLSGYVGVDVFFVISGYVIFGTIKSRSALSIKEQWVGFYYRRLYRIIPPLAVVAVAAALLNALFIPYSAMNKNALFTGLGGFLGVANYVIEKQTGGYFEAVGDLNMFHHMWSLSLEEQFYFVAPIIVITMLRYSVANTSLIVLSVGFLVSLGVCGVTYLMNGATYLSTPSRAWEILAGGIVFELSDSAYNFTNSRRSDKILSKSSLISLTWCLMVLILILAFVIPRAHFPFPGAILPVIIASLLVYASSFLTATELVPNSKFRNCLLFLGRISYSLYLWNWVVVVFINWTIGLDGVSVKVLSICASVMLATGSWFYIEKPTIEFAKKTEPKRQWSYAVSSMILAMFVLMLSFRFSRELSISITGRNKTEWYQPDIPVKTLIAGDKNQKLSGNNLFVFGDSHAQFYRGLFSELKSEGIGIYLDGQGGRGFSFIKPLTQSGKTDLEKFLTAVGLFGKIGDVVFFPALRVPRLCNYWIVYNKESVIKSTLYNDLEAHEKAVREFNVVANTLTLKGFKVLIDGPKPVLPVPAFRCSDWFNKNNPIGRNGISISREELDGHRNNVMEVLQTIVQDQPNMFIWDPFKILCPDKTCSAFEGERVVFFDGDHLSNYGCQKLKKSFLNDLEHIFIQR